MTSYQTGPWIKPKRLAYQAQEASIDYIKLFEHLHFEVTIFISRDRSKNRDENETSTIRARGDLDKEQPAGRPWRYARHAERSTAYNLQGVDH